MYLRQTKQRNGRIYLSMVENYYDREKKCSRQRTVKKLGYLDALEQEHEDPVSYYEMEIAQANKERLAGKSVITIEMDALQRIPSNTTLRKNFGYAAISTIYHQLGIHTFLINRQRHSQEAYDANAIMKLLVYQRLIAPGSKKKSYEGRERYFERSAFSLHDVYRSLTFFACHRDTLLKWLHEHIKERYGRDTSLVYYDVTNYYFEIDGPEGYGYKRKGDAMRTADGMRKKGVSKEHRPDPIVQMGLFIDNKGLPITYGLFAGNTNDCMTYRPNLSQIKLEFGLGRAVVVADKGMATGDNIWYTLSAKDGYVFSLSVRGAGKHMKAYVLDETGYEWLGTEYKRKSRLSPRTIYVTTTTGAKMTQIVHEKQVCFYSEKYDQRAKAERAAVIAKAQDLISHPAGYTRATSYGAAAYVKNLSFDKKTGEILQTGKKLELDWDKLREDELYDGYYMIVSSEHEETDERIMEMYRGLWKIEESFRVTKTELEARPVFVSRIDHIEAHFLTCFIALLIARILEMTMDHKYSIGKILESLRSASCTYVDRNLYLFDYTDDVLADIGSAFGIDFSKRFRTLAEIKNIFARSKSP
jgi:hypothetical protein